jgi:hypothetical protein
MKYCAIWISLDPRSYGTWLVPYSASKSLLAVLWIRILALCLYSDPFFCADPDPHHSGAYLLDWPPQIPAFHFDADPDPAFHLDAEPDATFHYYADPNPTF